MICATRAMGHIHTTTTKKATPRIQAWLAEQPRPDLRFGNATALHMCGGSARRYRKTQCARRRKRARILLKPADFQDNKR